MIAQVARRTLHRCRRPSEVNVMAIRTDAFDLGGLRLGSGEGRRLELAVTHRPIRAGRRALRRGAGAGAGAARHIADHGRVATRCACGSRPRWRDRACAAWNRPRPRSRSTPGRSHQPGAGEELESPYVQDGVLDVRAWARDALALALPTAVLCRPDCAGLCPVCGVDLNSAGEDHHHDARARTPAGPSSPSFRLTVPTRDGAPARLLAPWPSPSRSSHTPAPRSAARLTRSRRRRTTPARSATARGFPTACARCAAATTAVRYSPRAQPAD